MDCPVGCNNPGGIFLACTSLAPKMEPKGDFRKEKGARISPNPFFFGRSGGIRTHDPLSPRQVRYQAALRSVLRPRHLSRRRAMYSGLAPRATSTHVIIHRSRSRISCNSPRISLSSRSSPGADPAAASPLPSIASAACAPSRAPSSTPLTPEDLSSR